MCNIYPPVVAVGTGDKQTTLPPAVKPKNDIDQLGQHADRPFFSLLLMGGYGLLWMGGHLVARLRSVVASL